MKDILSAATRTAPGQPGEERSVSIVPGTLHNGIFHAYSIVKTYSIKVLKVFIFDESIIHIQDMIYIRYGALSLHFPILSVWISYLHSLHDSTLSK